jgi:hypothetical protein
MNAGKLCPGCRQWPLFEAMKARGSMTGLEGVQCLAAAGITVTEARYHFDVIRKGAAEYGYELLPAEPVKGTRAYRYTLRKLEPGASSDPTIAAAQVGASRPAEVTRRPAPSSQGALAFPPAWQT